MNRQVEGIIAEIKRKNQQISDLNHEIEILTKNLEEALKILRLETPQTFVSRLASTPVINTITQNLPEMPKSLSSINLTDRIKHPKDYIQAFEKITKFYDYKSNSTILRNGKFSKYPRYICKENADPSLVKSLLMYGFIDKIMVDETLTSISMLPSLIAESVQAMMQSYGPGGIYGVQVFDACTDLTGKPILICQIFKYGRNTAIEGDSTSLKAPMPCTLEEFEDWICNKRAIGIAVLKSKLEDFIRGRKACVLGSRMGGDVEEILTLYYNNDVLKTDTTELTAMYKRIIEGKYNHSMKTRELYKEMTPGQRRKTIENGVSEYTKMSNSEERIKEIWNEILVKEGLKTIITKIEENQEKSRQIIREEITALWNISEVPTFKQILGKLTTIQNYLEPKKEIVENEEKPEVVPINIIGSSIKSPILMDISKSKPQMSTGVKRAINSLAELHKKGKF
ncbi:hypothetical protein ACET3Z_001211 [Daucus carota]